MIKKGVLQITVDLKSLQIKIAITNFVFIKLLQNVNSKCYLRFFEIFCFIILLSDPLQFTAGIIIKPRSL